jgi:hypothetical protein
MRPGPTAPIIESGVTTPARLGYLRADTPGRDAMQRKQERVIVH